MLAATSPQKRFIPTIEIPHELHVTFCLLWASSGISVIERDVQGKSNARSVRVNLPRGEQIVIMSEFSPTPAQNGIIRSVPSISTDSVELMVSTDDPTWALAFPRSFLEIPDQGLRISLHAWEDRFKRELVSDAFRSRLMMERLPAAHMIFRYSFN
ncbi:MAG: hypothetical protein NUV56_02820 [Candidatus Uhrbacteria bacterium]|nr:hypothetical protein [Candidatus Uhrbacteria bacterium]